MKRRQILGAMAMAAASPVCARAAAGLPLTLLVAGPDGGLTSRWGNAFALAIAPALPGSPDIVAQPVGGLDGVTGANRLDALVVPDGRTAAILPGAALTAFLTGDSRVHFDPTRWQPLLAGVNSGVLMLRATGGAVPDIAALRAGPPLRLAADQPQSRDLAALLAFARLGVGTAPVFGLRDANAKTRAFLDGEVDAVFLCGEGVPEDAAPLTAAGAMPLFSIGGLNADGSAAADPFFPNLPDALRFAPATAPELDAAYNAAAAAARLDFLLVLPRLCEPDVVGQWAEAAAEGAETQALMAAASASAITLLPSPALAGALAALAIAPSAQTGLQAFLAKNYGWQPG